jgi:hypothetical protein
MNKFKQLFILFVLIASFVTASTASAASVCPTGYNGPDDNSNCTSTTAYACAVSGGGFDQTLATIDGISGFTINLTLTDGVYSGTGTNNGVTFDVTLINGETCFVTATIPATLIQDPVVIPTVTVPTAAPTKPTVLANTSADSKLPIIFSIATAAAIINVVILFVAKRARQ